MKKFREILSSGDKGFTLIELLVVIAVLGILAGIAIPRLGGVTDQARLTEATSAIGSIKTAMEMAKTQYDSYPSTSGSAVVSASDVLDTNIGEYITELPTNWEYLIDGSGTVSGEIGTNTSASGDYRIYLEKADDPSIAAEFVKGESEAVTTTKKGE